MSVLRSLLNSAVFGLALAGTCVAIGAAQPFPKVLGVYQKWLYFKKNKDQFDTIFVGSSRVYHGVVATQFDDRVKQATGQSLRSFNAAYDAMWPPESLFMVRQLLAMKPAKLRWVFLECLDIYADLHAETRDTRRTAYWHDWRHTAMAWASIRDRAFDPLDRWQVTSGHATILLRNWTNQGLGAEWLGYEFGVERRKKDSRWDPPEEWKHQGGYQPEPDEPLTERDRRTFLAGVEARKKAFPPRPMPPSLRDAFAAIIAEIRAAGAEPIILVTPTIRPEENFAGFAPDVTVWSYHDAHQYPALYDPANRHDPTHLNDAGAKIFTDLLADRFAAKLKEKK